MCRNAANELFTAALLVARKKHRFRRDRHRSFTKDAPFYDRGTKTPGLGGFSALGVVAIG
jgi:hypothetical protein